MALPNPVEPKQSMTDFAVAALEELERNGVADLLLLKNDQLRNWWLNHKAVMAEVEAKKLEKERLARVKEEALAKLSMEERQVLGLGPKTVSVKTKRSPDNKKNIWTEDWDEVEYTTNWSKEIE